MVTLFSSTFSFPFFSPFLSGEKKPLIGVVDSGSGGLTLLSSLEKVFPEASFLYKGDYDFFPYGEKSSEAIVERTLSILKDFREQGVDLTVLACYTSSSCCWPFLRYDKPHRGYAMLEDFPVWDMIHLTTQGLLNIPGALSLGEKQWLGKSLLGFFPSSQGFSLEKVTFMGRKNEKLVSLLSQPRRKIENYYGEILEENALEKDFTDSSLRNKRESLGDFKEFSGFSKTSESLKILSTPRTHEEGVLKKTLEHHFYHYFAHSIVSIPCPPLANLMEKRNFIEGRDYIENKIKDQNLESKILLGCTHYYI